MLSRSFHFIPSHRTEFFKKVASISADQIIFDLEDGVPENLISKGKKNIKEFVGKNEMQNIWVRIHNNESTHFQNDLEFMNQLNDVGIVIPKFNPSNWKKYPIDTKKIILIETIRDLFDVSNFTNVLREINIFAIGFGLEDMLTDFYQSNKSLYKLINFLKGYFIICNKPICNNLLDSVYTGYNDKGSFEVNCHESYSFGFSGRFSIHPKQLGIINKTYDINEDVYNHAKRIVSLAGQNHHLGYSIKDGILLTPPKLAKSKTIINKGLENE